MRQKIKKNFNLAIRDELTHNEIDEYIYRLRAKHPNKYFKSLTLTLNGEFADVEYNFESVPFERIRRITGYLVGTVNRVNDAKRAEVLDRVSCIPPTPKSSLTRTPNLCCQSKKMLGIRIRYVYNIFRRW